MQDDRGIVQLWTISPNGGEANQVTQADHNIQSAFSWHPQGGKIALVCDNSVMLCDIANGNMQRLTKRTAQPPLGDAVVFSPDGKQVAFMREVAGFNQIFVVAV
jgi:Tol biopolymer transport system component